jgi:hypothetical protein
MAQLPALGNTNTGSMRLDIRVPEVTSWRFLLPFR